MVKTNLYGYCLSILCSAWLLTLSAKNCVAQIPGGYELRPDVVYGHKDGMALTYDVFTPKENARGVGLLFMVSGGWVSQWMEPDQMAKSFLTPGLQNGYTIFAVRHGSSPRYVVPEVVGDVKLALKHIYDHAMDYAVDRSRLGVFGFSAGGHLSLILGTQSNHLGTAEDQPRVAAVVAVFPPTDLQPYVDSYTLREQFPALKFDLKKAADVSPLKHVSADDAPTLLIHGDKDELVPISHSHNIAAAFEKSQVQHSLITIEGAGHGFDAAGNKRMVEGMIQWFDKQLKK